jgi:hypothetical protein
VCPFPKGFISLGLRSLNNKFIVCCPVGRASLTGWDAQFRSSGGFVSVRDKFNLVDGRAFGGFSWISADADASRPSFRRRAAHNGHSKGGGSDYCSTSFSGFILQDRASIRERWGEIVGVQAGDVRLERFYFDPQLCFCPAARSCYVFGGDLLGVGCALSIVSGV